jgi:hypothetical protein
MDPEMAQTEAEPPTSSGAENAPIRTAGTSGGGSDRPVLGPWVALVVILLAVVALLVGGGLFLRQLTSPPIPVAAAPTTVAAPAPTVGAAPTTPRQALAPATLPPATNPTATALPTGRPTPAPTAQPTALPRAATEPSAAAAVQTPEQSPLPTVAPDLRREVETAYSHYWDARAQAVWTLDPAALDDVATGDELLALQRDVDQLRTDGRAIKAEVEHQFTVVSVAGDEAQVADRLRDFSIYVDASTKEPLPGQVRPDEANAPLSTILYFLHNEGGTWKVERGERHVNS